MLVPLKMLSSFFDSLSILPSFKGFGRTKALEFADKALVAYLADRNANIEYLVSVCNAKDLQVRDMRIKLAEYELESIRLGQSRGTENTRLLINRFVWGSEECYQKRAMEKLILELRAENRVLREEMRLFWLACSRDPRVVRAPRGGLIRQMVPSLNAEVQTLKGDIAHFIAQLKQLNEEIEAVRDASAECVLSLHAVSRIAEELTCPISGTLLTTAVHAGTGIMYNADCLDRWARIRSTCPITRLPLHRFVPMPAVRNVAALVGQLVDAQARDPDAGDA